MTRKELVKAAVANAMRSDIRSRLLRALKVER